MRKTLIKFFALLVFVTLGLTSDLGAQAWDVLGSHGFSAYHATGLSVVIGPGGTPYVALVDNTSSLPYGQVMQYTGGAWTNVGAGMNHSTGFMDLVFDHTDTAYVIYEDNDYSNKATVRKYNGSSWVDVGIPGFSHGTAYETQLSVDGNNKLYASFADNFPSSTGRVMTFDGTSWNDLGSPYFNNAVTTNISSALWHDTLFVAYADSNKKATVMKYSSGSWSVVGNPEFVGLSIGKFSFTVDTTTGTPYLAFSDSSASLKMNVMKFDGANWVYVGLPNFTAGGSGVGQIVVDNTGVPYLAFADGSVTISGWASVMKYSGGSWAYVGAGGFTGASAGDIAMTLDASNEPFVAYEDYGVAQKATVMAYLSPPASIAGAFTVCVGSTTTLTDATASGTWSSGSTGIATVGSVTGVVTGVSTGTATISYRTAGGFATQNVTVITTLNPGSISGASALCVTSTTTVSDAVAGGVWSSSNSAIAQISSAGVITGSAAGTITISYAVTNSCGTTYATRSETVQTTANAGSISGIDTVCETLTITLSDAVAGGTWSSSNTAIAQVSSGVVTGMTPGTATISYTLANSCNTANATQLVTVRICEAGVKNTAGAAAGLKIFPSPNHGSFTLNISSSQKENATIIITNILGEKVKEISVRTNEDNAVMLNVAAGVYFVTAATSEGKRTEKIVVE